MNVFKSFLSFITGISMILLVATISIAQISTVKTHNDDDFGPYLTDEDGMSLYLFVKDSTGESTCFHDCAQVWHPVLAENNEIIAEKGVDSSMVGTIKRSEDSLQVTYNGWPLYYYADDRVESDKTGQNIQDFGAKWYLIDPKGKKIEKQRGGE